MRSRAKLESLYGIHGADLLETAPETRIACNGSVPFHVHFRENKLVADDALRIVGRMTQLEELVANETAVTDVGLVELRPLSKLRLLHLAGTAITDAGLSQLRGLPLQMLDLSRTPISDAGLPVLATMQKLEQLWLVGCACTPAMVEGLRAALPGCKIVANEALSTSQPASVPCRVAVCRELLGDDSEWSIFVVNTLPQALEVTMERTDTEWGDQGYAEKPGTRFTLPAGGFARVLRVDGDDTEVSLSITLLLTANGTSSRHSFALGRLYRYRNPQPLEVIGLPGWWRT